MRPIALFHLVQIQYNLIISTAIRANDSHKTSGHHVSSHSGNKWRTNVSVAFVQGRMVQLIRHSSLFADQHHLLYISIHHQSNPVQDDPLVRTLHAGNSFNFHLSLWKWERASHRNHSTFTKLSSVMPAPYLRACLEGKLRGSIKAGIWAGWGQFLGFQAFPAVNSYGEIGHYLGMKLCGHFGGRYCWGLSGRFFSLFGGNVEMVSRLVLV